MASSAICCIAHQPPSAAAATSVNTMNRFLAENSMIRLIMTGVTGAARYLLLADVLLGVLVELLFAAFRAKLVSLPFVFGFPRGLGGIDIHAADGVFAGGARASRGELHAAFGFQEAVSRHHDALAGFDARGDLHAGAQARAA